MINIKKNPILILSILIVIIVNIALITSGQIQLPDFPKLKSTKEMVARDYQEPITENNSDKVNACFVVLIRNKELKDFIGTMTQLENRFNNKYNYPYVFLNDKEFSDEFKDKVASLTNSTVEFGVIPENHWSIPNSINKGRAEQNWREMAERNIPYGGSESYRHMCRYESGFFFRHELTLKYDYYWRVEPGVEFLCDVDFDPFLYMKQNNKLYGFTISTLEFQETIRTLWYNVKAWVVGNSINLPKDNALQFISNDQGRHYNGCHFWTNFEIAAFSLWRDPQYLSYFDYLDKAGGFFYERWGDAPVHSIYASLVLNKTQIHFFNEIGYKHAPNMHCPPQQKFRNKCDCSPQDNFDLQDASCTTRWLAVNQMAS